MADQKPPPKLTHLAPKWFHEIWDALIEWLTQNRPIAGIGIEMADSPGGKIINVRSRGNAGGTDTASHPFKVTAINSTDDEDNPTFQGIVELDSWLLRSLRLNDKMTITGLGSPFDLEADTVVYLEITMADGAADTVEVKSEPWPGSTDKPYSVDDEDADNQLQQKCWHIIAEVREDDGTYANRVKFTIGGDPYEIHQVCRDNLVLCQTCVDGLTLLLPFPYSAPALQLPATE